MKIKNIQNNLLKEEFMNKYKDDHDNGDRTLSIRH